MRTEMITSEIAVVNLKMLEGDETEEEVSALFSKGGPQIGVR